MKRKQAFTLIETLVSIVIVGVIAVITTPIISDVIDGVKESSFKASIEALIRTVRLDVKNNVGQTTYYRIENGTVTRQGQELKIKGSVEGTGYLIVDEDGAVSVNISYANKCATKDFTATAITVANTSCTVSVSATTPVITLIGNSVIEHRVGRTYTDLGVLAMDNNDGNITDDVIVTGSVNSDVTGTYVLTYTVTNSFGNTATTTRTVNVVDAKPPVLTVIGDNPLTYQVSTSFVDPGATAIDEYDGDISNKILKSSTVTPTIAGTYKVTYYIIDAAGNSVSVDRIVNVVDTTLPTVTFGTNGNATYAKTHSTTATISDNGEINTASLEYQWTNSTTAPTEASFTTTFTNGANLTSPSNLNGGYYLWILAKDSAGNTMISRSNAFNMDNTGPTIAFSPNGNAAYAKTYSATATVSDANSNVNTSSLEYQWTNSTTAPTEASFTTPFTNGGSLSSPAGVTGGYYLWILAKDNLGNTSITRSNVFNLDNTPPTPPVISSNPTTLTNSNVTVSFTYSADSSVKKYLVGQNNVVDNWQGKTISGETYSPAWKASLHPDAIDMQTWTDGYNGGVPSPEIGYHGMWVYEGIDGASDPGMKFIDRNDLYGLGHRWLGISQTLPIAETTTWQAGNQLVISWMQKTDVSGKGASVGLHHSRVAEGTYGFEACQQTVNVTSTNVWEEVIITCTITSNWDLTKSISVYVYGSYGNYGTLWVDDVTVSKLETDWTNYSSNLTISSNKTIFAYATDAAGNTSDYSRLVIDNIDQINPIVVFGTNGNTTYAKTYSTTVTVTDNLAVNTSSLEYQWTTSTTAPTEASFTQTFTSGGTLSTPAGVSGGYYLWILAKDTAGNTVITRTNVFNIDNIPPVITINGNASVNYYLGTTSSYVDSGSTASDNRDGNITSSIVTVVPTINTFNTYYVTYNVSDSVGNAATQVTRTVFVDKLQVDYLIVAGGGGGGMNHAGGGGAGGLLQGSTPISVTAYTITVGNGGAAATTQASPAPNGGNSVALGLTAIGGGGGGCRNDTSNNSPGVTGGSGGGGGGAQTPYPTNWNPGNGTTGQGNVGGRAVDLYGGGGGGAGGAGTNASSGVCGDGGAGIQSSISGTAKYYAGGGGGGSGSNGTEVGTGGSGIGGNGSYTTAFNGTYPAANTGSGGGGGGPGNGVGSAGAAGVVIIRYYGSQRATGGAITTVGGYTIHTFTSSGTFTITSN